MHFRSSMATLVAITLVSVPAAAQSAQRWSIQASGLYVGVGGEAYDGLDNGAGGEVQVRLTPSLWSYGLGAQYSSHELSQAPGNSISLSGVFFEPRRVFDVGSARYAPYLSGRAAFLQQEADFGNGTTLTASGFQANVGGGVLTRLTPRVNLDLGATVGAINFGDAELKQNGQVQGTFSGTSGTGQNIVFRAGLAIGLGGGAKAKAATPRAATPATKRR